MDERQALMVFGALSQETRLKLLRLLVVAGSEGISAGSLADQVEVSPSNVSFHLKELERAGLVTARRDARSIVYSAAYDTLAGLIRFLVEDCCSARPEVGFVALQPSCCVSDPESIVQ